MAITNCRDEASILRFIRFFYNISRKRSSIGKDIANQLPAAIKLMLEYSKNEKDYDVCTLIAYNHGRKVLIDEEEMIKLKLFKTPPKGSSRDELETLFWKAEDHKIFDGEIAFLLNRYTNIQTNEFDLEQYKKTWAVIEKVFTQDHEDYSKLIIALMYYGNTWIRDTPIII